MIARARRVAAARSTTLNQLFRDWLRTLDTDRERILRHRAVMAEMEGEVLAGRRFTRDEMNER